jgi:hypothetical protein
MKLVSSPLLVLAALSVSAAAAPPSPPQALEAPTHERLVLATTFAEKTVSADKYIAAIREMASSGMDCSCRNGASKASFDRAQADKELAGFMRAIEPEIRSHIPWLLGAYAFSYAREYSADELRQMINFAATPAGQHFFTSRIDVEFDESVMLQQEQLMKDLVPAVEKWQRKTCLEHAAQRVAAGDRKATCPLARKAETAAG